jgi:hypothetical protein
MIDPEVKSFIDEYLLYGEKLTLAKEYGITPKSAYGILGGYQKNPGFVTFCYNRALKNYHAMFAMKKQTQLLKQQMASL